MSEAKTLRPDTGDSRSLTCMACGVTTPDSMFCAFGENDCGGVFCGNCLDDHDCSGVSGESV